ncbi:hypothetical protein N656DRAFT_763089 [Canariomyces notabilis]|uniref:Uncharacterized protein n=1 Tax=Canariomyces notabilis TaxID=2074819 RepID=A0AAN6QCC7_9PEZI|nr:hypothetical protein N656DRAFT_763089 [Canariomyces arenarius]
MARTTLTLLASLAALAVPSFSTPIELPPIDFNLAEWWTKQLFPCPVWGGTLPNGYQDLAGKYCSNVWTKTWTQGSTTARLYQVPGDWQSKPRYNEFVNGFGDAIQKGLGSFGSLAGPLTINVGIAHGGVGEYVKMDDDNSGTKTPCYILVEFPADWENIPLTALQKDIIQAMYRCVEHFHHPTVTAWTDGNEWWRRGIARYFDGLSYPAQSAFLNRGLYPEEYHYGVTLYQNEDAAALFFHYADQHRGWTPTDVHNWMKGHANKASYDEERTSLAADPKITPGLWHGFILASIDGTIAYPGGQKITNVHGGPPKRVYNSANDVVAPAAVGQEYSKLVSISSFKGGIHVFSVKPGQTLRVSVQTEPGVEWSLRKVGTTAWNSGARDRTVELVVSAGQGNVNYEIAISSTMAAAAGYHARVRMVRSA